jgi:hypothetical protein
VPFWATTNSSRHSRIVKVAFWTVSGLRANVRYALACRESY